MEDKRCIGRTPPWNRATAKWRDLMPSAALAPGEVAETEWQGKTYCEGITYEFQKQCAESDCVHILCVDFNTVSGQTQYRYDNDR